MVLDILFLDLRLGMVLGYLSALVLLTPFNKETLIARGATAFYVYKKLTYKQNITFT